MNENKKFPKRQPRTDIPGKMILVSIKLQPNQKEWLEKESELRGCYQSDIIREMINERMENTKMI